MLSLVIRRAGWWLLLGACSAPPQLADPAAASPPLTTTAAPSASTSSNPTPPTAGAPEPLAVQVLPTDLGGAYPTTVGPAAQAGSWIVICQAEIDTNQDGRVAVLVGADGRLTGDDMRPTLFLGPDTARPISAVLAVDPMGRYLSVRAGDRTLLVDAQRPEPLELDVGTTDSRSETALQRTTSFDAAGKRLAYLRRSNSRDRVIVRDLASGTEHSIDPGPGRLHAVRLAPAGHWVILDVLVDDTNGNGRLDPPVREPAQPPSPCTSPIPHSDAWLQIGDTPIRRIVGTTQAKARPAPGLVLPLGRSLVFRDSGGHLRLGSRPAGGGQRLGSADCKGQVLRSDATRGLLLVACEQKAGRPLLHLLGKGLDQPFELDIAPPGSDHWPTLGERLWPVYSGLNATLVDLDRKALRPLEPRDQILHTRGAHALVRRDRGLLIFDAGTSQVTPLSGKTAPLPHVIVSGNLVFVTPMIIDVAHGRVVGRLDRRPLALRSDGQALVPVGAEQSAERVAVGPLRWVAAR